MFDDSGNIRKLNLTLALSIDLCFLITYEKV